MPQHLRDAAHRRHEQSLRRAADALTALSAAGKPITFAAVAREAGISTDFLYRQPQLRQRIHELRSSTPSRLPSAVPQDSGSTSGAVRALSVQIKELRRRHHEESAALRTALAVAQGENLALRRKLATYE
ncbi:Tn554-related, transposase C [Mycobacteroides abscessus subsp. abscessus]|uniref:Transposase n=1 Tax=Mycobacteroides abscessus TaxID=36809 RepID=A0ABD7HNL1_9MYCO|nr:DUF6262 family protein [Mycobacteroides abscessus]RIR40563.1 transposase [Mycobacteroides abscessus]RIT37485.1 transposase [Mycobacteroides abscessus]SKX63906.1 Tn554-related, transposase C [Mycobacteroides abscessus subsp. abscessus]